MQGDRSAFLHCRFLGHQDTLYADSMALSAFARQYYAHCYAEGDVDFVFGRATAVYEHCHFHTLSRTDLATAPYGFVFAPSTAAPDAYYKLARPWVPGSDPTARPMLTVRDTWPGPGIDAAAPVTTAPGPVSRGLGAVGGVLMPRRHRLFGVPSVARRLSAPRTPSPGPGGPTTGSTTIGATMN